MNDNQIIRIPYKYWELINTMEDCESWKLMKALFMKNSDNLEWLSLTYYNIIIVDIDNLENQVKRWQQWGKLWWRPRKNKEGVTDKKTPPLWNKKPKIKEDKIKEDKVKEDIKEKIKHKYWEYKNVLITDKQKNKLLEDFGEKEFSLYIKKLDEYIQIKWASYKDHNLVMRNWKNNSVEKKEENKKTFEKEGKKDYLKWLYT